MSLNPISSCADTDLHHDSGSKAISGLVTDGLAQAKKERRANVSNANLFIVNIP
jgi:hypothetical protein